MKTLTVALAQSLVVAAFFAVPSFAEEALKKDVVPLPMRAGRCLSRD